MNCHIANAKWSQCVGAQQTNLQLYIHILIRDYMNARRVAKELEILTKGLNRNLPAVPPTLSKEEMKQVYAL